MAALAESIDRSTGAIVKWESGKASPNAADLAKMAKLGLDVGYIITGRRSEYRAINSDAGAIRVALSALPRAERRILILSLIVAEYSA